MVGLAGEVVEVACLILIEIAIFARRRFNNRRDAHHITSVHFGRDRERVTGQDTIADDGHPTKLVTLALHVNGYKRTGLGPRVVQFIACNGALEIRDGAEGRFNLYILTINPVGERFAIRIYCTYTPLVWICTGDEGVVLGLAGLNELKW